MKTTVKIFAIIGIVLGGLALFGSIDSGDVSGLVGGALFIAWGIVDLAFLNSIK